MQCTVYNVTYAYNQNEHIIHGWHCVIVTFFSALLYMFYVRVLVEGISITYTIVQVIVENGKLYEYK